MDRREHTRLLNTLKPSLQSTFIAAVLLLLLVGCSDYTSLEQREMIFTIGGVSGWGAAGWNLYQIEK